MLSKIKVAPGINRDTTSYTNSGGWYDSDFIRFRNGLPEKIGGWTKVYAQQTALIGECRKMYDWSTLIGTPLLAIPTNIKFYLDNNSEIIDITPLRRTITLGSNPLATTTSNNTVVVTDVNHGAVDGDYITISGATAFNALTTDMLNKEFQVASVVNANAYTITVSGNANATSSGGGSSVVVAYQFHAGTSAIPALSGWGSGAWGQYGWGEGPNTTLTTYYSGLWSVDNYGEDMIACPRDLVTFTLPSGSPIATANTSNVVTVTSTNHGFSTGQAIIIGNISDGVGGIPLSQIAGTHTINVTNANAFTFTVSSAATSDASGGDNCAIYKSSIVYWDVTDADGPAISISDLGAAYAKLKLPYVATEIMVSDQNRQVIAFGCNPWDVTLDQDKMVVRWSDSSDPTNWDVTDTGTTAGEQRLSSGSFIVTAAQNREEILIWTDASLFTMSYIGPPYGYGFNLVGTNFDIIGANSKAVAGSIAYWMGTNNFYMYDGKIEPVPCTVRDYVFTDISIDDGDKVYCSTDTGNNEVIWFYPSETQPNEETPPPPGQREVDRYVVYNYQEQVWYYGSLARTAWIDRRGHSNPRAVSPDGYLYNQESGFDDGSTEPALPINAYIESSPIEINDGHNFLFVTRVIPDLTFQNSETHDGTVEPTVKFTIKPQDYPGAAIGAGDERNVTRSNAATLKVNRFTDQVFTRLRARSVILRVESDERNAQWRLGTPRFDMRQDGRR